MAIASSLLDRLSRKQQVFTCTLAGLGESSSPLEPTEVLVNPDGPEAVAAIVALRDALRRISYNFDLVLAGKPVRDAAETKAEVVAALAKAQ